MHRNSEKSQDVERQLEELRADIVLYLVDRENKKVDLMKKYGINRNTLTKYIDYVKCTM